MFSIKLNSPVLLRKQLPVIAKALRVDEKVLEDFMTVSAFYGVKDGKGTIVPIKKTDTIVYIDYKAYDSCYFVVDAILQYAKDIDTSVTLPVITEIELGTDVFKKFSPVQLSDIMFLTRRLKDGNERVTKLAELNAPDILLANERALLCKKVESLDDNEHTPKPDRNIDGHVCASLHDIGYSILDGWLNKNDSAFESDGKNNSGYDPDKLAALVKKAIGTRTQEQFSQASHLGRVYVNRLANGKSTSVPTETTLKKIAKATKEITENELRLACGYASLPSDEREVNTKRRAALSDTDWAKENVKSFLDFLKKMIPLIEPLSSLNILQTSYETIFFDDDDKIYMEAVSERSEYHADGTAANVILPVRVRWFSYDRMQVQAMYFALIGHMSADNEFYVTGYLTSVKDLYASVPALRDKVDRAVDANLPDGIDVMEFPVFYSITHVKAAFDKVKQEIIDKCNSYLDSNVKVRIDGYGFFTDTLDEDTFKKFLKCHEAVMTNDTAPEEIKDFYENVVANDGNVEDFLVEDSDYDTVASIIAYVANAEHKDTYHCDAVDGFNNTPDSTGTESCVLSSDIGSDMFTEHFGVNRDDVCADLKAYAAELGLSYGRVSCYMMVDDKNADACGVRV